MAGWGWIALRTNLLYFKLYFFYFFSSNCTLTISVGFQHRYFMFIQWWAIKPAGRCLRPSCSAAGELHHYSVCPGRRLDWTFVNFRGKFKWRLYDWQQVKIKTTKPIKHFNKHQSQLYMESINLQVDSFIPCCNK